MDEDLNADAGLAFLASSDITIAPSHKGKPHAPRNTATVLNNNKELTPEERARESTKRKGRRHAADAMDEAAIASAISSVAEWEDTVARIAAATREVVLYLG
ncbi:hypothetical protein D1007_32167 [Hordeum vulgare]|nr:hypothetical protein D1007_32167 [Hordeum vulgare]